MSGRYDGSIRINTEIDTSNVSSQVMRATESIRRLENEATRLRARLHELETTQIPTDEYNEISKKLGKARNRLEQLIERQQRMQTEGRNSGAAWERINRQIEVARGEVGAVETQMQELVDTGRAFRLGSDTDEYQRTAEQLRRVESDIEINNRRLQEMRDRQDDASDGFEEMADSAADGFEDMGDSAEKSLGKMDVAIKGLKRSIGSLLASLGLGLSIAGLVMLGKQAVEIASDIQEVQNVVDTAFESMSYKMEQFADTAITQFGISKLSAKQMGSTFMTMGRSMIGSMEEASDMAIALTGRSADMASFYNKTVEETSTALKSIYTGETETLKEYGVVMTEVNLQEYAYQKGINKKISAMTQAEQVQLRYNYVMEQTSLAAGDFAKTSDSWANQTRILSEQFKELLSVIGSGLITVLTPVIKFLNTILTQLIAIAKQIGAILSKLFGISIPVADSGKIAENLTSAADGADELEKGIEAAGKAANKALAPFDKLNVLSQNKGGGKGGTGAGGGFEMPDFEMDETGVEEVDAMSSAIDSLLERLKPLFDWFVKLKDLFVQGFFDGLGESWKDRIDEIIADAKNIVKNLKEIFTDPDVVASAKIMIEKIAYALGQVVGSFVSVGITIAQNIVGGIDIYLEENKEFLKQKLISIFDITGDIALLIGEACATIAYIFEAFGSESGQQLTANIIGIFVNTTLDLLELAEKFGRDILKCIVQPISDNKEELRTALEGLLGVFADVAGTILDGINATFAKMNEVYDQYFKPFFDNIATGLSELLAEFLLFWNGSVQPLLDKITADLDTLWKSHIQPLIDNVIELFGKIAGFLNALWEETLKPFISWIITDVAPVIIPIIQKIWDFFIEACEDVIDTINFVTSAMGTFIDWLTEHQSVVQDFIIIIASFIAVWEVSKLVTSISGIVSSLSAFITSGGLAASVAAALGNSIDVLGNSLYIMTSPITGIASLIGGILVAVKNFITMLQEGFSWLNEIFMVIGIALAAVGAVILGAPALVAGVVAAIVAAIATIIVVIHDNWDAICEWFSGVADWINENVIQPIIGFFKGVWDLVSGFFSGLWNDIVSIWSAVASWFSSTVIEPLIAFFQGLWTRIKQIFEGLWIIVQAVWIVVSDWFNENVITPVVAFFQGLWESVSGFFISLWEDIVVVWETVAGWFDENVITPVTDFFKSVWDNVSEFFSNLWEDIQTIWRVVSGWFNDNIITPVQEAFETACNVIGGFFEDLWTGIKRGIASAMNAVIGGIEDALNWLVDGINGIISGFNRVVSWAASIIEVDWGGVDLVPKVSLGRIPMLADGAVIRGGNPFMAVLGDQPHGQTNIETPLPTMVKAFKQAMAESGGMGGEVNVKVYLGEKDITKAVKTEADRYFKKTGKSIFAY